jgi:hypothetical protein
MRRRSVITFLGAAATFIRRAGNPSSCSQRSEIERSIEAFGADCVLCGERGRHRTVFFDGRCSHAAGPTEMPRVA